MMEHAKYGIAIMEVIKSEMIERYILEKKTNKYQTKKDLEKITKEDIHSFEKEMDQIEHILKTEECINNNLQKIHKRKNRIIKKPQYLINLSAILIDIGKDRADKLNFFYEKHSEIKKK